MVISPKGMYPLPLADDFALMEFDPVRWLSENLELKRSDNDFESYCDPLESAVRETRTGLEVLLESLLQQAEHSAAVMTQSIPRGENQKGLGGDSPTAYSSGGSFDAFLNVVAGDVANCRQRLGEVLASLDRDRNPETATALQRLAQLEALRDRLNSAHTLLSNITSWEFRVRELERHFGSLRKQKAQTPLASFTVLLESRHSQDLDEQQREALLVEFIQLVRLMVATAHPNESKAPDTTSALQSTASSDICLYEAARHLCALRTTAEVLRTTKDGASKLDHVVRSTTRLLNDAVNLFDGAVEAMLTPSFDSQRQTCSHYLRMIVRVVLLLEEMPAAKERITISVRKVINQMLRANVWTDEWRNGGSTNSSDLIVDAYRKLLDQYPERLAAATAVIEGELRIVEMALDPTTLGDETLTHHHRASVALSASNVSRMCGDRMLETLIALTSMIGVDIDEYLKYLIPSKETFQSMYQSLLSIVDAVEIAVFTVCKDHAALKNMQTSNDELVFDQFLGRKEETLLPIVVFKTITEWTAVDLFERFLGVDTFKKQDTALETLYQAETVLSKVFSGVSSIPPNLDPKLGIPSFLVAFLLVMDYVFATVMQQIAPVLRDLVQISDGREDEVTAVLRFKVMLYSSVATDLDSAEHLVNLFADRCRRSTNPFQVFLKSNLVDNDNAFEMSGLQIRYHYVPRSRVPSIMALFASKSHIPFELSWKTFQTLSSTASHMVCDFATVSFTRQIAELDQLPMWTTPNRDNIVTPTSLVTAIGDLLLSLAPHFQVEDAGWEKLENLQQQASFFMIFSHAVTLYINKTQTVPAFSVGGLLQLLVDLGYLRRALCALSEGKLDWKPETFPAPTLEAEKIGLTEATRLVTDFKRTGAKLVVLENLLQFQLSRGPDEDLSTLWGQQLLESLPANEIAAFKEVYSEWLREKIVTAQQKLSY